MTEQSTITIDTRAVEELIVERAKRSYARLPMLEVVFDRFALSLAQVLKAYLGAMVDVSLDKVDYLTCQDAIDSLSEPSLIGVTEAAEWSGTIAAALRPELLYSILEITFGGRTVPESPRAPRSFTSIEKRIGKAFCEETLKELSVAFEKVTPVSFEISHLETNPKALLLAPPTSSCARAVLRINIEDRIGEMVFLLPTTALDAVSDVLSQNFTGGQLGGDTGWRMKLTDKLGTTNIPVAAVLGEARISLREVLSWVPGQVLDLGVQIDDPVTLCVTGKHIARAEVGRRKNGKIALKVSEKLYEEEDLPNVLLD
ncbi:flagellar motor switch protein FliM [Alloyangia pacifica]|uniref:Flagellar motor switch protein FliM n=1 Tax=Alloyangia pacifica TaxID=311180 RepID=A0A1I6SZA5_9RHOB|nr:FliM/FliN family flagellar motor switch protein [Alloyangia pacifica]SDG92351.1 flagellar motor switch protein FliM [Alloyangia pacifica]SFS82319.1 flagellar motor switch protein FliM [Alloyangia pacifica]